MSNTINKGSVELYLLSEFKPVPAHTSQFDQSHYRPTGVRWPIEEFDGIYQIYRHSRLCQVLEREFGTGDAIVLRYERLNLITTLIPLDQRSPILWNGEAHKVFQGDPDDRLLLQLPKSFRFDRVSVGHE